EPRGSTPGRTGRPRRAAGPLRVFGRIVYLGAAALAGMEPFEIVIRDVCGHYLEKRENRVRIWGVKLAQHTRAVGAQLEISLLREIVDYRRRVGAPPARRPIRGDRDDSIESPDEVLPGRGFSIHAGSDQLGHGGCPIVRHGGWGIGTDQPKGRCGTGLHIESPSSVV